MDKEIQNGDIVHFLKKKDYVMVNDNLGSGSFGRTVLLQDPFIEELFVCKKYEPDFGVDEEQFYKNFIDEIKILYKLNHLNVVRVYNYYVYPKAYTGYILMEFIDGENIGDFFNNYDPLFSVVSIDSIFIQLIDAFCYIESCGIIHRDIREGNILIDKDGVVKVIDFGIGKVFSPCEENDDSLVGEINRGNSDTLPQEYYEGTYSNLTDMFYLAELFQRLIKNMEYHEWINFTYDDILEKMLEKSPQNRFASFAAVKEAIGKYDFINMEISSKDKTIYQEFANGISGMIVSYSETPSFVSDASIFVAKIKKVLELNAFEDTIQNKVDLIRCIVQSDLKYRSNYKISCQVVRDFLTWFKSSTELSQSLILTNIISKLSQINVEIEEELPF